jgi:hypothetical protein
MLMLMIIFHFARTWRKLSDDGKEAAKGLEMPDGLKDIVAEATQA